MDYVKLAEYLNGPSTDVPVDDAPDAGIVADVCRELARGSDVADACAASGVDCARFLAWTVDDVAAGNAYQRALRIRARLLSDAPLAAARAIRDARVGGVVGGHRLGDVVRAAEAEAALVAGLADRADPPAASVKMTENTVRIVFDPLPSHAQAPLSDVSSVGALAAGDAVSRALPASYVIVRDELDA